LGKRYRGMLDADADDFIGFAVDGAHRMQTLINDLLAYSRVGMSGKEFASVDCESVLATVLSNLSSTIEETQAIVSHDPLPEVRADATQLCQVFQNLIANALKFHGPEAPRIHISSQPQGGEWQFSVRDNGIGIDPQNANRIFVIFQRLHAGRDYPGTGIGLAIVKKIVERHGGRVWVESQPDQGSTFTFTLPITEVIYGDQHRALASKAN
jgi:light-regulated signal transduction histidine kinase (bacteriophytochrome)